MRFHPQVSLVIVSRNRPEGVKRLIASLRFQSYPNFEVIIVSNYAVNPFPNAENIRQVFFDQANISAARNLGIEQSAGEIIAFCDDDAVPEVFWLERLVAAFEDPGVGSAGGFVRGRNGIDYQWTAIKCNQYGDDFPLEMAAEHESQTFHFDDNYFAKVQGTNCAFRKKALAEIGGFDENYRFFLDETDVSFTLAKRGWSTVVVPLAEVQHGFEESAERTRQRVPKTLENIGASKAYFIAKHADDKGADSLQEFQNLQRERLLGLMVDGYLEPLDVERLLKTLRTGLNAPIRAATAGTSKKAESRPMFKRFSRRKTGAPIEFVAIAGTTAKFRRMSRLAMALQAKGVAVTIFRFSYTALFHKRFFDSRGYWIQTGGLFGKSNRFGAIVVLGALKKRVDAEIKGLSRQRPFKVLHVVRIFQKIGLFLPD
ncbi:MAG: glycosyltransferase [Rhodobacteraceae bacterium]|nr:glycosyltransferase [Paracoccaceae bacterium]